MLNLTTHYSAQSLRSDNADTVCLRRHAMLVDQRTEGVVVPLNLALDCDGRLELANSSLSEMAVLGVRDRSKFQRLNREERLI